MTGKTVCVVGMGRIGQAIARRCHFGFGCRIVYANRSSKTVDFPSGNKMDMPAALAAAEYRRAGHTGRGGYPSPDGRGGVRGDAAPCDFRQHLPAGTWWTRPP